MVQLFHAACALKARQMAGGALGMPRGAGESFFRATVQVSVEWPRERPRQGLFAMTPPAPLAALAPALAAVAAAPAPVAAVAA
jgi:hypothetical protein